MLFFSVSNEWKKIFSIGRMLQTSPDQQPRDGTGQQIPHLRKLHLDIHSKPVGTSIKTSIERKSNREQQLFKTGWTPSTRASTDIFSTLFPNLHS
jgi:hypothetical protein